MTDANPNSTNRHEGILLSSEETREYLNDRQLVDYHDHREGLIEWMLYRGKNEAKAKGYAESTVRRRASNLDMFYRWVWQEQRDGYTTRIEHADADAFIDDLVTRDCSGTHKSNLQKTIRMYFRWRAYEYDDDGDWECDVTFSGGQHDNPQDYLTLVERRQIREAALEYGAVPHYCSLSPEERNQWKVHLARRYGKPTTEIGRGTFERANGYKIPSLVCTSLDAGLRPVEVERAKTSWVDTANDVLRIPAKKSAKNRENWNVALQSKTSKMLQQWIVERECYEKYDDTDVLWLTRENNPYQSTSLKYLLHNLCEKAGIDVENRQMTWYSIRHSLGSYMTRQEDLKATKTQLRHRSAQTTMKYDQAPVEDRRDALNRME